MDGLGLRLSLSAFAVRPKSINKPRSRSLISFLSDTGTPVLCEAPSRPEFTAQRSWIRCLPAHACRSSRQTRPPSPSWLCLPRPPCCRSCAGCASRLSRGMTMTAPRGRGHHVRERSTNHRMPPKKGFYGHGDHRAAWKNVPTTRRTDLQGVRLGTSRGIASIAKRPTLSTNPRAGRALRQKLPNRPQRLHLRLTRPQRRGHRPKCPRRLGHGPKRPQRPGRPHQTRLCRAGATESRGDQPSMSRMNKQDRGCSCRGAFPRPSRRIPSVG
jgi:hypothetical protein